MLLSCQNCRGTNGFLYVWILARGGTTTVMPAFLRTEVPTFPSVDNILVHILSTPVLLTVKEVSTIHDSSYVPVTREERDKEGLRDSSSVIGVPQWQSWAVAWPSDSPRSCLTLQVPSPKISAQRCICTSSPLRRPSSHFHPSRCSPAFSTSPLKSCLAKCSTCLLLGGKTSKQTPPSPPTCFYPSPLPLHPSFLNEDSKIMPPWLLMHEIQVRLLLQP